ncbi:MAG: response regulator [Acidobacteriia bacterium]|nr:response regulator [Terriglobia bacterium]
MKRPFGIETAGTGNVTVLCVSPSHADGVSLQRIFYESGWGVYTNSKWTLIARTALDSAFSILREAPVPIVICEGDLSPGTWQEMLEYISLLPDPPLLIVISRLADDRLWAEALNLGAYDVLAKPFDAAEVIRIVSLAWRHWQDRHDLHCVRTRQRMAAVGA